MTISSIVFFNRFMREAGLQNWRAYEDKDEQPEGHLVSIYKHFVTAKVHKSKTSVSQPFLFATSLTS